MEIDDILLASAMAAFVGAWFAWRRWRESRVELARRVQAEGEGRRARDDLRRLVDERTVALAATERRAAEAHTRLLEAIEAMPDGFILHDGEDRLVLCNSRYREARPERAGQLKPGVKFEDHLRESVRNGLIVEAVGREEEWIRERMEEHRDPQGAFERKLSDGRWIRVVERKTRDGGIVAVHSDITELKRGAEALRASEGQLRMIADALPVLIGYVDAQERYRFANRMAANLYGRPREEVVGQRLSDLLVESAYRALHPLFDRALSGEEISEERLLDYRDGSTRSMRLNYIPDRDDAGAVQGFFVLGEDVTAWKEAEARLSQFQKLETIGQLTGGVAHDFNNLLGVVLGNLELLEDRVQADARSQTLTGNAIRATLRGAELTQRLLAYSRKQALQPQVVGLNKLLPHTTEMLRRTLEESIRIEVAVPDGLWLALVDPGQLENAILNLAVNARDAMPDGGTLTIEAENISLDDTYTNRQPDLSPGDYVMIAVSDSGAGIPAQIAEHVFDPFFTTKEVGQGSGLGLSMVYGFVKQSGGHVSIYSEEGHGTSVKLFLPRTSRDASPAQDRAPCQPELATGRETVLVVEDDPALRLLAISMIEGLGYTVLAAEDGPAAMALLHQAPAVDLLFTDVVLPNGMHGVKLAQKARRRYPHLKVLLTTGYAKASIMERLNIEPGVQLLHKPYRRQELAEKVRAALDAPEALPVAAAAGSAGRAGGHCPGEECGQA